MAVKMGRTALSACRGGWLFAQFETLGVLNREMGCSRGRTGPVGLSSLDQWWSNLRQLDCLTPGEQAWGGRSDRGATVSASSPTEGGGGVRLRSNRTEGHKGPDDQGPGPSVFASLRQLPRLTPGEPV
jgi:hypothetical protein